MAKCRVKKGNSKISFPENYIVIDVETTGYVPERDSLIEIGAIKVRDNKIFGTFNTLVNPNEKIPAAICNLTGISNEILENAPSPSEALKEFLDFIDDDILVGHNVNFDINFLYDNLTDYLNIPLKNDFIDTLRISKKLYPDWEHHKLEDLVKNLKVPNDGYHRALKDCYSTYYCYEEMKSEILTRYGEYSKFINLFSSCYSNSYWNDDKLENESDVIPELLKLNEQIDKINKISSKISLFSSNLKEYTKVNDSLQLVYDILVDNTQTALDDISNISHSLSKAERLAEHVDDIISSTIIDDDTEVPDDVTQKPTNFKIYKNYDIKNITTEKTSFDVSNPFYQKKCVFTGEFEKMSRKEAAQLVVDCGGQCSNSVTLKVNYLIVAKDELEAEVKTRKLQKAEELKNKGKQIEIISEESFYEMIGI